MRKTPRRAVIDSAGQLYTLERELAEMRKQREALDEAIGRQERKIAAAEASFDATLEKTKRGSGAGESSDGNPADVLTPGKLPQRVLAHIERQPGKIHTAADLSDALAVRDVQKIRTALARLVQKGLLRRAGSQGEFTL